MPRRLVTRLLLITIKYGFIHINIRYHNFHHKASFHIFLQLFNATFKLPNKSFMHFNCHLKFSVLFIFFFFFNIQYSLFIRIHRAWQIFPTKSVRLFFRVYSLFEHLHAPWVEGNYKSQKKISWMQTIGALKILVVHLWKFIYKKHDFFGKCFTVATKASKLFKEFQLSFFFIYF